MYKKILLPIALDHQHRPEDAVAIANALLDKQGELILLHVLEDIPAYVRAQIPADALKGAHEEATAAMEQAAQDAGAHARGEVIYGHAGTSIIEYAEKNGCDCIVIASHRPGLGDYLLGSTAARVVRHAACAVHVMR